MNSFEEFNPNGRSADFKVRCGNMDGNTDPAEHLAGLIYLDVQVGDDSVSGWVRPEVSRIIKAAFGKPEGALPGSHMSNANEAAFPHIDTSCGSLPDGDQVRPDLNKRELFAAMAMQGMVSALTRVNDHGIIRHCPRDVAEISRVYADALLSELSK